MQNGKSRSSSIISFLLRFGAKTVVFAPKADERLGAQDRHAQAASWLSSKIA
jgi:hypothetical protein